MLERLHHSLAARLAALYAVVFLTGAALVFGLLYYILANALDKRERTVVEKWAEDCAALYERGGAAALRAKLNAAETGPEVSSLLIRIIGPSGDTTFARVPPDWIEKQVQTIPLPGAFGNFQVEQVVQSIRIPRDAEKDFTIAMRPLQDGKTLQIARSTDNRTVLLAPLRWGFLIVGTPALILASLAGGFLAWGVTRPLRQVNETARNIVKTGDLEARVPPPEGSGELADLVNQFNTVLSKNATLINAQKETLDNLAHDLRTPLTRLRGTADLALQSQGDPVQAREALADCLEEAERIQRMLETMLDVSAAENGTLLLQTKEVPAKELLEDAADLYKEVAEDKGIAIEIEAPEGILFAVDPTRLGQALANLVDNAIKYTPSGGRVVLSAKATEGDTVEIQVKDTGPGVPVEEREKIWRRLYRGDRSRSQRGLGLGLSLVKAIVLAHSGDVAVSEAPGGGAVFTLIIPKR